MYKRFYFHFLRFKNSKIYCNNSFLCLFAKYMNFERFNISFLLFDDIRLSNLFKLGQLQKYGFIYCLLKCLKTEQTSKKWYLFSIKPELHILQILSALDTMHLMNISRHKTNYHLLQ